MRALREVGGRSRDLRERIFWQIDWPSEYRLRVTVGSQLESRHDYLSYISPTSEVLSNVGK